MLRPGRRNPAADGRRPNGRHGLTDDAEATCKGGEAVAEALRGAGAQPGLQVLRLGRGPCTVDSLEGDKEPFFPCSVTHKTLLIT